MKANRIKNNIDQLSNIICFSSGRQIFVDDMEVSDPPKAINKNSTPPQAGDIRKHINKKAGNIYQPDNAVIAEVDKILERLIGL